ncbi:MAG: nitrate reductase molybdenum cofactor assembly chaperone [Acidobacteria bacterium]|nr:nitrate reductase molybdenum cofactor assembly chaperone [Acidobacteriota bacterium]
MNRVHVYEQFAKLLEYPGGEYVETAELCRRAVGHCSDEAERKLGEFQSRLEGRTAEQLQELFVQTFDLNPVCVLEVGWHLYGDNYDRGAFLVKTREQLRRHGVAESTELPDHLTHVLALLARMEPEEASTFAAQSVIPALDKMLAGITGKASPYEFLLSALRQTLASAHTPALQGVNHE